MRLLPFILLIVPLAEIATFIVVGSQIGVFATLAMIFVTAVIGSILLRRQGLATAWRIREKMDRGELPGRELGNGAMILVAGVLLLTPGFITDALGFALFVPQIRDVIWRGLSSRITVVGPEGFSRQAGGGQSERVVDLDESDFSHVDDDDPEDGRTDGTGHSRRTGAPLSDSDSPWSKPR